MNKEKFKIRKANLNDVVKISFIEYITWKEVYKGILKDNFLNSIDLSKIESKWQDRLLKNWAKVLVAEFSNEVVGVIAFGVNRDDDLNDINIGEIYILYVDTKMWRRGCGTRLVNQCIEETSFDEITVWIIKENPDAIKFYKSLGFRNNYVIQTRKRPGNTIINITRYSKKILREC